MANLNRGCTIYEMTSSNYFATGKPVSLKIKTSGLFGPTFNKNSERKMIAVYY